MATKKPAAKDLVYQMLVDQDGLCAYCETRLWDYHLDHMTPRCQGGTDGWDNLAVVCARCNMEKGKKSIEDYFNARPYALLTA